VARLFNIFFNINFRIGKTGFGFGLGGGMALLVVAAIVFFFLSQGGFLVSVVASSLCIAGLLVMLRGIKYMHEERKYQIDNPS